LHNRERRENKRRKNKKQKTKGKEKKIREREKKPTGKKWQEVHNGHKRNQDLKKWALNGANCSY
jgi:hypothetical protein